MAAADAVVCVLLQRAVVLRRQRIARPGEVVILVHKAHVDPRGAGLAVAAVNAFAARLRRREGADHRIVRGFLRLVKIGEKGLHVRRVPHPGQHREHAGLIEAIADALVRCERLAEGRPVRFQQLPAGKGLHHRYANALGFTPAVDRAALVHAAVGVFALPVVVGGVHREHQHIHVRLVHDAHDHPRGVGGKADMAHHARLLQRKDIVVNAVAFVRFPVGLLILAVDEAVVDVIGAKLPQLFLYGPLYRIQRQRPAVFAARIVRAEVDLEEYVLPQAPEGLAVDGERVPVARGEVEVIHAALYSLVQRAHGLVHARLVDIRRADPDLADPVAGFSVDPVFHGGFPCFHYGL